MSEFFLFLLIIFLIFLSIITQSLPAIILKTSGIDVWRWLLYAEITKKNNHLPPKYINSYIINARYSYPPLFHIILSFIPSQLINKYSHFIAPLISAFENLLITYFIYFLSGDLFLSLISTILYVSTSSNIIENTSLNTRNFGQFLFCLFYICLYYYSLNFIISYFLIVLTIVIILLSHRFTTQVITFIIIAFSIYHKDLFILFLLILSIILTIFLTKGFYLIILKAHINQVSTYVILYFKNKNSVTINYKSLLSIFSRNLFIFLFFYLNFSKNENLTFVFENNDFLVFTIYFIIIISIITTYVKPLRSIGEGYRYIGYLNLPLSVFICSNIINFQLLYSFCILSLIPALYKNYLLINKKNDINKNGGVSENVNHFFEKYLNSNVSINFLSFPPIFDDYVSFKYRNVKVAFHDNGLISHKLIDFTPYYFVNFNPKITLLKYNLDILVTNYKIKFNISNYRIITIDDEFYAYIKKNSID
jgi:hypothetical protein